MRNNKRYLIAGFIGAGAFLLASAGASAHLGSNRSLSDQTPNPSTAGAANLLATAPTPEPSKTPQSAATPEPAETPEAAKTPEVEAAVTAGSDVEQDGEHEGGDGGDSGD
jgi:hypothetical protein